MRQIQLHKSVHTVLKCSAECHLTGRLMLPGEKIVVFPRYKRVFIIPLVSRRGTFFIHITCVPFVPEKDYALYESRGITMGMITNASL